MSELLNVPKWEALAQGFIAVLENPDATFESKKTARESIMHMGHLADVLVEKMKEEKEVVRFDGVMYMREPQFSLRVNGNSSSLCPTEEECKYENAVIEFSDMLVELVKVYPSFDGENFSYEHPIKIVSKSNIREVKHD